MKSEVSGDEIKIVYASKTKTSSDSDEEGLLDELLTRDERVERLIMQRDRARGVRLTADEVPVETLKRVFHYWLLVLF